jgi:hypothetical protein
MSPSVRMIGLALIVALCLAAVKSRNALVNDPSDWPVMSSGYAGVPPLVMDPNILSDDEGLHLFYSSYFCQQLDGTYFYSWDPHNNSNCNIDQMVSAIGYAFAPYPIADDSPHWEYRGSPVFAPGGQPWEQYKVETAFVVKNDTHLQLYYSAIGFLDGSLLDNRYQVGVAFFQLLGLSIRESLLSPHEQQFSRTFRDPLIAMDTISSSFLNNVQEPSVVVREGKYEVYFLGLQFSEPTVSADAPNQTLQLIGLGCATFTADFEMLSISAGPLTNTAWRVNMPEVHYSPTLDTYAMISASLASEEVHKGEVLQISYGSYTGKELVWSPPQTILKPQETNSVFSFSGWATTSPTMLYAEEDAFMEVYYSAFGANRTDNDGGCDYSTRFGIGVPDPACLYVTLGRAH